MLGSVQMGLAELDIGRPRPSLAVYPGRGFKRTAVGVLLSISCCERLNPVFDRPERKGIGLFEQRL